MTGDRVAEIRERVDALASTEGYGYLNADKAVKANAPADLAYLLDENARLRAQLDTARKVADKWQRHGWLEVEHEREQGWVSAARQAARDFHAALNQGGDTNGG